jgi:four helix bundle protein
MSFASFEEILAWKEARILNRKVRNICKRDTVKRDFNWIDQISSATLSVMANIAEGNDSQSDAEFVRFLIYAKRSATEVRSHLYYGLDEGYVTQSEFNELSKQTIKIGAQLATLVTNYRQSR